MLQGASTCPTTGLTREDPLPVCRLYTGRLGWCLGWAAQQSISSSSGSLLDAQVALSPLLVL